MTSHPRITRGLCAAVLCAAAVVGIMLSRDGGVSAQEREDRTLLNWDQMRAIINEASGERAMHHVQELVPYPRVRPRAEYLGHFRESEVMAAFAKEYGYSSVEIESFPAPQRLWQATQGELWLTTPDKRKLYDIYDVAISLAPNSDNGDVTADVIDVGIGARPEDYQGKDVAGKVVLGSAGATVLQRLGVFERGAVGVISYTALRPDSYPDLILSSSIVANAPAGKKPGFGWIVAPRVARELAAILGRGEKVTIRSIVRAETFPGEMETVHATIQGDGSSTQEVVVSGHLYEGYIKQGANDDNSGCALTLEMGRAYIRLVKEGLLPKPKRTIHFLWVPEISGTNAWLNKHGDIAKKLIADLNFDMEGLGLVKSGSRWVMHRTPDTFPSFLNDIGQSVMEFVAALNEERVRFRANGYRFTLPVTAPNGSQDPFYISIEKHYGASDHVTYMQHGIPAVIFVTWPDMWYHSSQDTPDKLDSTQFKRAAVVGVGSMTVLAAADDAMAARVAAESLGRGTARMGDAQRKGLAYLTDATDASALTEAYKEAKNAVRHQASVERGVVKSASVLFTSPEKGQQQLAGFDTLIDQRATALQAEVSQMYRVRAEQFGPPSGKPAEPTMTATEQEMSTLVAARAGGAGAGGGFGGGGGGGGGGQFGANAALEKLPPAERTVVEAAMRKVPQHMTAELNILLAQQKTVLEMRDFLAGEFDPLPLADLVAYLRAREKLGQVTLTPKPAPTPTKGAKPTPPRPRR